jgi:hypothetical protein
MPSSPSYQTLARRIAKLEQLLAQLLAQLLENSNQADSGGDGWERRLKRVARTGDSVSTVDRHIKLGFLEKRRWRRAVYVREARRPPKPKHAHRPRKVVRGDDPAPPGGTAEPNLPAGWPFVGKEKEP